MNFKTIGSSSVGNSFLLGEKILIDLGLPYSKIKEYMKNVKYVLLTHEHCDHLKSDTLRKVCVNHDVTFICGKFLLEKVSMFTNKVITIENTIYLDEYAIAPIIAYHDVPNYGYRIMKENYKHLHITDTNTLEGVIALNYDSASIECNHDVSKIKELIKIKKEYGEFSHLEGTLNSHLNVDEVVEFVKTNNINKLYPVHIGQSSKKEVLEKLEKSGVNYEF